MGAACYPIDAKTYEELFMQADKALYIACEKGHNRYVIYDVNKHGTVQTDRARDLSDLYAAAPTQSNAAFAAELVRGMLREKPDVQSVIQRIGEQFGLDGISVFTAPDWSAKYRWGHPVSGAADMLVKADFRRNFSADGVCVIDNVNALEGIADDVYAWLSSENLLGTVLYFAETGGAPFAGISFGLFGRFRKWSTPDTGHLTVLGGLIAGLLENA